MAKRCIWDVFNTNSTYPERLENEQMKFILFSKPYRDKEKCLRWIQLCDQPHGQLSIELLVNNYNFFICTKANQIIKRQYVKKYNDKNVKPKNKQYLTSKFCCKVVNYSYYYEGKCSLFVGITS